jgi:hypothetical protein
MIQEATPPAARSPRSPPEPTTSLRILGVDYVHRHTPDGGDLYLTPFGRPFVQQLLPENWLEEAWFEANRQRLEGSSAVYRIRTKPVLGRSADLVVKWCRVGEQVPFDTMTLNKFAQAEFNSPYEEFSLLMEMRQERRMGTVRTHRPLAILVPPEKLQVWQTGRSASTIARKKARHRDVELDICRQYILIYEWVEGLSAVEALARMDLPLEERTDMLARLTRRAIADLAVKGFRVLDMKPAHIIVRLDPHQQLLRDASGDIVYALVDFELLERTPEHATEVIQQRRNEYLRKQRDRFSRTSPIPFPEHLAPVDILGTAYVFGHAESTHGSLWVVGRDPELFDYFLPERWRRTRRVPLSKNGEVYYTRTKDNIHVVWRVSRVGERPDVAGLPESRQAVQAFGYNSPFEQFSLALDMANRGIPATYPRAIYVTGLESQAPDYVEDPSRFDTHQSLLAPDGEPILKPTHNYITIWGFWNGPDERLAGPNPVYCEGISLLLARQSGYISHQDHDSLLDLHRQRLAGAGFEDLGLGGDHVLLAIESSGQLVRDRGGVPEMRHCSFQFVKRIPSSG